MNDLNNSKILIIDDSKLNRLHIKNTLLKTGNNLKISLCTNGQEGLDKTLTDEFDLIFVDLIMPEMDGLTFLKKFKKNNKKSKNFIPVILMTGNEDLDSKIESLNVGADDFLQKPVNQKELLARTLSLIRLKKAHDLLYKKNIQVKKELESAKKVQEFIIPKDFSFIKDPFVTAYYLPMEDIGGDFYDCYKLENGNISFLIADVTGHGIPAALVVTMSKMIFSIYAPKFNSAKNLLTKVNTEIFKLLLDYQYITAFYAIYNPVKKILRFSNAGHCFPLLYRKKTKKIISLDTEKGFFIGMIKESFYAEKAIKIENGDKLFLYTDGITEIKNTKNEEFGIKKLASFIRKNENLKGKTFNYKLLDEINNFSYKKKKNDDIAFMNIEF